jgi:DNA polymerase III, delta subunit
VEFVRERIRPFATTVSFKGRVKICFIDEADFLSKNAQAALRKVVEDTFRNCRYIFAVNEKKKIVSALQSRLMPICFDIDPSLRFEVKKRLIERYEASLMRHAIGFDRGRLEQIVGNFYPDLRAISVRVEFEFGGRGIQTGGLIEADA